MKKYLLCLAMLVAVSITAKAQLSLGIKGGVNLSNINTDNLSSSNRTGYQAGVFARIGGGLYVQPEMYVSGTGGDFHANDNSISGHANFTNLNIPVLIGKRFGTSGTNFRIMAGPGRGKPDFRPFWRARRRISPPCAPHLPMTQL